MSLYDVDIDTEVYELMPPDKRTPRHLAWVQALASPMARCDTRFAMYREGNYTAASYDSTHNYAQDDIVRAVPGAVYISLADNNMAHPVTDINYWEEWTPLFIGLDERIKYDGTTLRLTYTLNRIFNTVFRQPPLQSDIYLVSTAPVNQSFIVGSTEANSSDAGATVSTGFVGNTLILNQSTGFSIHLPLVVYNSIPGPNATRNAIIKGFADKFVTAGISYTITTY